MRKLLKRQAPDPFQDAFDVVLRAVGARMKVFMHQPPMRDPVSEDELDDAIRRLVAIANSQFEGPEVDLEDPEQFDMARREMIAQAYEEVWAKLVAPTPVRNQAKRDELRNWMEAQAGRELMV